MPATAGRVRMPANNRVHSSAALQTHGIWQSAIGYDPYAPTAKDSSKPSTAEDRAAKPSVDDSENAYASFQGLLALARITGTTTDETRGACTKCGRVGHLTFQCRNFLSVKDDADKDELAAAVFDKIKKSIGKKEQSSCEEDGEETDSSDSDVDPAMEKIIAARFSKKAKKSDGPNSGEKKSSHRRGRSKRKDGKRSSRSDDDDVEEERKEKRRHRRRSHRGSDDDSEEESHKHRKSRKERKRRRSHQQSDDSDNSDDESYREARRKHHHKRRNKRHNEAETDSDTIERSSRHQDHRSDNSDDESYREARRKRHHKRGNKRQKEAETDSDTIERSSRHRDHRSDRHHEHGRRVASPIESKRMEEDGARDARDKKHSKKKYKSVTRD